MVSICRNSGNKLLSGLRMSGRNAAEVLLYDLIKICPVKEKVKRRRNVTG
jgi:hypothetical protein